MVTELEKSILPHLGKTVKLLDLYIEDQFADAGIPLTKLQYVFLMIIQRNQAQPQNSLAELTGRDKTIFTRNIRTLERKNLVQRDFSPSDRRNKLVSITPLGEKYLELARPILKGIIGETEQDISHEEREKFLETLNKIKSKLCQLKSKHPNSIS